MFRQVREILLNTRVSFKMFNKNYLNLNKEYRDIKYGDNHRQYYRIYEGKDGQGPIVFFIHGGGWWHGSPKTFSMVGEYFSKLGYTVVMPAYRLVPIYKYPNQIEDVTLAFRDFCKLIDYKNNTREIIIGGFSAGGELAVNLVFNEKLHERFKVDTSFVKKVFILSGVLNFNWCKYSSRANDLINNYLGDKENYRKANPITLVKEKKDLNIMCIHGSKDPLIPVENSISFIDRVKELKMNGRVVIVSEKQHIDMLDLISGEGEIVSNILMDFLKI